MNGFVSSRRGPLSVVEMGMDEEAVQRELSKLSDRLFLTKEIDRRHGCWAYSVLEYVSDDHPPIPAFTWRDEYQRPLPLSMSLIDKAKQQEGRGRTLLNEVDADNQRILDGIDREATAIAEEAATMAARFGSAGHSAMLPRSKTGVGGAARRQERRDRERRLGLR